MILEMETNISIYAGITICVTLLCPFVLFTCPKNADINIVSTRSNIITIN